MIISLSIQGLKWQDAWYVKKAQLVVQMYHTLRTAQKESLDPTYRK